MSSKDPAPLFQTILENIDRIERFTHGMHFDSFTDNEEKIYAVRAAMIELAEAAIRLGRTAETLCPDIPWRDIRHTGNVLRHGYDAIDLTRVWKTVTDDLPVLRVSVSDALHRLRKPPDRRLLESPTSFPD